MSKIGDVLTSALWQFNEAVSLLREARDFVPADRELAGELEEGLPVIQAGLEALAKLQVLWVNENDCPDRWCCCLHAMTAEERANA